MSTINTHYLHVELHRAEDPGRGLHNKVRLASSITQPVSMLEDGERYSRQLAEVCQAVLVGVNIYIPAVDAPVVFTIVYPFDFSSIRTMDVGVVKLFDSIIDAEKALQADGEDN